MEKILKKLTAAMENLVQLHTLLLEAIESEKEAIIGWDMEKILMFSKNKEKYIFKIQEIEEERRMYGAKVIKHLNLPNDTKLSSLLVHIPVEYSDRLNDAREKLLALINNIKYKNMFNSVLALKTNKFLGDLLENTSKGLKPISSIYSRHGKMTASVHPQVLNKNL